MSNHTDPIVINNTADMCALKRSSQFDKLQVCLQLFIGLRLILNIFAMVANLKLLCLQRKAKIWFQNDRPFILGILIANLFGSVSVIIVAISRLASSWFNMKSKLIHAPWLQIISDACVLSLVLYIGAISLRGYFVLKYFSRDQSKCDLNRGRLITIAVSIMITTLVLSLFGFNTHSQSQINETSVTSKLVFFIACLITQLATALILYKTRQLSLALQIHFALNRDQQRLESRVALYRVIERTRTLIPLSALNVGLWITLWSLDIIIDCVLVQKDNECGQPPAYYYVWSSIMDCSAAIYGLLYPSLLTRKREPLMVRLRKALFCKYELIGENGDAETKGSNTVWYSTSRDQARPMSSAGHWTAMESLWDQVEKNKDKITITKVKPLGKLNNNNGDL